MWWCGAAPSQPCSCGQEALGHGVGVGAEGQGVGVVLEELVESREVRVLLCRGEGDVHGEDDQRLRRHVGQILLDPSQLLVPQARDVLGPLLGKQNVAQDDEVDRAIVEGVVPGPVDGSPRLEVLKVFIPS